jgi:hypothetical protein
METVEMRFLRVIRWCGMKDSKRDEDVILGAADTKTSRDVFIKFWYNNWKLKLEAILPIQTEVQKTSGTSEEKSKGSIWLKITGIGQQLICDTGVKYEGNRKLIRYNLKDQPVNLEKKNYLHGVTSI